MELSKYNKLEKLGYIFWKKKQNNQTEHETCLIGESTLVIYSCSGQGLSLPKSERFINSIVHILDEENLKKVDIENVIMGDIKSVFLFDSALLEILDKDRLKIFSYPSITTICNSANTKKDFLLKFREDLT